MMKTESVDRYDSEFKKERIKDKGGEDIVGNHRGRMDRGEAKCNKVNKYCSLEYGLVTKKSHINRI